MYKKLNSVFPLIHSRVMDNSTTSGNSYYIDYWVDTVDNTEGNSDVPSASTFETQTIGGVGSAAAAINRIHHLSSHSLLLTVSNSQSSSMVNVFGESVGSGSVDLQLVKKVVATVGTFGDYTDEIQQSYELEFTPYGLHTNEVGICYPHSCL